MYVCSSTVLLCFLLSSIAYLSSSNHLQIGGKLAENALKNFVQMCQQLYYVTQNQQLIYINIFIVDFSIQLDVFVCSSINYETYYMLKLYICIFSAKAALLPVCIIVNKFQWALVTMLKINNTYKLIKPV